MNSRPISLLKRTSVALLLPALIGLPAAPVLAEPVLDRLGLAAMVAAIEQGKHRSVEAVIVERGGETLFEDYYGLTAPWTRIDARSAGKSITALAVGMAIDDGALAGVDLPLLDFFSDRAPFAHDGPARRAITLADLLTMSSALDCNDSSQGSPGHEGRMYNSPNWTRFALDIPIDPYYARDPDTGRGRYSYCTAGVFLLGRVVERAVGAPFEAYVQRRLFDPLGIVAPVWWRAPEGVVQSGGQLRLRASDFSAIGRLVLDGGQHDGETIVSPDWLRRMLQPRTRASLRYDYGYLWWMADFHAGNDPTPHRAFSMRGNGGNQVVLFPDLDAVVTILATNYNQLDMYDLTSALILQYILPALTTDPTGPVGPSPINRHVINDGLRIDPIIGPIGILEGGMLSGVIASEGEIHNVLLASGARVEGGHVGGTITGDASDPAWVNAAIGADAVLRNVRIGANATLHPDARLETGVCFTALEMIPAGFALSSLLDMLPWDGNANVSVLDLDRSLDCADGARSVLADMQQLLDSIEPGATLAQDPNTAFLDATFNNGRARLLPTHITRADASTAPGIFFDTHGEAVIVTAAGMQITALSLPQAEPSAREAFSALGLDLSVDDKATWVLTPRDNTGALRYRGRPHFLALPAVPGTPAGLRLFPQPALLNVLAAALVFESADGQMLEQQLASWPFDWPALERTLLDLPGASAARIDDKGLITWNVDGKTRRAIADYVVRRGAAPNGGSSRVILESPGDINGDSEADLMMTFANGDRQALYLLP
jgi:CubicO group peptidase (beta-lactamase class C family)